MQELNIYKPIRAKLIKIIDESPLIKTFVLVPEVEFSFKTGQFIEVTVENVGEAPFTPSSSPLETKQLEITVMKAGYVTDAMHKMEVGQYMGIRGPYGRGYPLEAFYDKEVLIVGGGCGFAPIRSLLYNLKAISDKLRKVTLCYGSKTPGDCIYKPYITELRETPKFEVYRSVDKTDESWQEKVGVVTVLLDEIEIDVANSVTVVCGPPIMMKFATKKLLEMGYPEDKIYLSMEKNMSCGVGKCGHCAMGHYFVCKDGPVFTYDQIKNSPNIWM
ncbi:MAG: FAD/NAD(P)-binding protein [Candidatus Cloacimonadaceae bacterium]|nr:FAD/NAD(P)-binding protein [Candidatus Cloacimonadaceae bacterium]MDP3113441.1 FAD/NAD(P)-binding protein [Candidatus Cloacimonadaceae bacterium]